MLKLARLKVGSINKSWNTLLVLNVVDEIIIMCVRVKRKRIMRQEDETTIMYHTIDPWRDQKTT